MARFTLRAVWMLLVLWLPVVIHAADVVTFVASGEHAYLEVPVDGNLQKIYTEHRGDSKVLFVLGEKNNPELLQFSFLDDSKRITTWVLEFRSEKGVVPPGVAVAGNEFLKSLQSDAKGFDEWQARFASFPDEPTVRGVLTDPAFADPVAGDIVDGDDSVFRFKDWICQCRPGGFSPVCVWSPIICVFNNLCTVYECLEAGEWTSVCHDALREAEFCLGEIEE